MRALLAAAAVLLTGCFDVLEEVWIEPDGSGRAHIELGMPAALMHLAKAASSAQGVSLSSEAKAAAERLRKEPDVVRVRFEEKEEGGQYRAVYEVEVRDVTKLPELLRRGAGPQKLEGFRFEISRLDNGNFQFVQKMGRFDPGIQAANAVLGERTVTVRVHGRRIVGTNGRLNEKADTAEWKLSVPDLASGAELKAEVQAGAPVWVWAGVIGVPLALLMLVLLRARRMRRA